MTDTQQQPNPIKMFFSGTNAKKLYGYIQRGLQDQYNVAIDERYMPQMIEIMKMVIKPLPKKIPVDIDQEWFVKTLNEQTLKEAIPIFADIAKGSVARPPQNPQRLNMPSMRPQQSTPLGDRETATDANLFNQVVSNLEGPEPKMPQFSDPEVEYPDDVNDLYEHAEQQRQQRDLQPPPDLASLPFAPQFVRDKPIEYIAQQESTPVVSQSFDSNAVIGDQNPRFNREPPKVQQPESTLLVGSSQLNFGDIAPQPSQMKVLIPHTSRNTIPDSKQIPHWFVINSKDRNPATYPIPSQYRIEFRQPYINVVSVELTSITIPNSLYNINRTNNIIIFEETAGSPLQAVVPIGNYPDATTVAMSVAASMTAKSLSDGNGVTYTSSINVLTGKVTLVSNGFSGSIFNLLFFGTPTLEGPGPIAYQKEKPRYPPNSIGAVLGYDTLDYTGLLMYEAPFVPCIAGEPCIYLHIDELELLESNNSNIHDAYAFINMDIDEENQKFIFLQPDEPMRFVKFFSPPKGKFATLTIAFRNDKGDLIDFNGIDHTFTLQIQTVDKTQGPYFDEHD
jgi:hypothetical protein